jgi:hypothetical protein
MRLRTRIEKLERSPAAASLAGLPKVIIEDRGKYYANHVYKNEPLTEDDVEDLKARDNGRILWIRICDPTITEEVR